MLVGARISIRPVICTNDGSPDGIPPDHQTSMPAILVPGGACTFQPAPVFAGGRPLADTAIATSRGIGDASGSPHEDDRKWLGPLMRTSLHSPWVSKRPCPSAHAQTL